MTIYLFALVVFVVGAIAAMQPPLNAQLAFRSGGLTAALISFAVGTLGLLVVGIASGSLTKGTLAAAPWYLFTGGLMGAAFVYTSLRFVPVLGATALTAVGVAGQLVGGLLIDRFGLFGLQQVPFTATRLVGIALLIAGAILVMRH